MSDAIHASNAPKAVGLYPHARRVGQMLYLSGIGPRDPRNNSIPGNVHDDDGRLIGYDIVKQCHSVFANVRAVLVNGRFLKRDYRLLTVDAASAKADLCARAERFWAGK